MQKPFMVLTHLSISSKPDGGDASALPDRFLGASAACLKQFKLFGVLFPALPVFLLSASNLVELSLRNIPPTGYIFPKELVVHVATLLRLEILDFGFASSLV
jgi:hypothetical protein